MNKNPSNADEIFRWPSRCSCERCNYARKAWESVDTGKINTNEEKYKKEMKKRLKNTDKSAEQFPNVLFFRDNKYSSIDEFIITNKKKFKCSIKIIDKLEAINKLYSTNYHLLITYSPKDKPEYHDIILNMLRGRLQKKWIHKKDITDIDKFNETINYCYIHNAVNNREKTRPSFSIFTTCYFSYKKILRAYSSIKRQVFQDWEWVIMDDTGTDDHFDFLRCHFSNEKRIRLYRRDFNSGNIGNVKNEAVSLCRGKYILELDHDDEIFPEVLKNSYDTFEKYPDVGFIYMNFVNLYENMKNFWYGDFISKGYGGYYCQKYYNQWINVYSAPNINNITMTSLTSLPNHPRIWRKKILMECGNFCEQLPICDDLEVLLRTVMHTKIAKINKIGYVQYMNDGGNNFSLIRNHEINRLSDIIIPFFFKEYNVQEKMQELNAYEDPNYSKKCSKIWKRKDYEHKYCNLVINVDYNKQYCIIGLENLSKINDVYENKLNDFLLLDNKNSVETLKKKIDELYLTRVKCYAMKDCTNDELVQYFHLIYRSCGNYEIIMDEDTEEFVHRHEIINSYIEKGKSYLEIGVETGFTISRINLEDKTGVDPAPYYKENVILKSSDLFFEENEKKFDYIFIDGMHHSDYVFRDFINSVKFLNEGGIIFVDDILPSTEKKQKRIPEDHYYDNGILKARGWTGDVWKVVYYLLLNYSSQLEFTLYTHENYEGMGVFKILSGITLKYYDGLNKINKFTYENDFDEYKKILNELSRH